MKNKSIVLSLNSKISAIKKILEKKVDSKFYLLVPEIGEFHILNNTAEFLWKCVKKNPTTFKSLVEKLCLTFDVDKRKATRDVLSFIELYRKKGIFIVKK